MKFLPRHPENLFSAPCKGSLLNNPTMTVQFELNQIDLESIYCEPDGVLVSGLEASLHSKNYEYSTLIRYDSIELLDIEGLAARCNSGASSNSQREI